MHNQDRRQQLAFARRLHQEQTPAEQALWFHLRKKQGGAKFRRQQPIGPYIVDSVTFEEKVVIEVDGGQHNEIEAAERDTRRTGWLHERGYRVMRFWNNDVLEDIEGVLEIIREALSETTLTLTLSRQGRGDPDRGLSSRERVRGRRIA